MICNKCGVNCVGFATGDPEEDICSDCAYPSIKKAREAACEGIEIDHWQRTGEFKTAGELLRKTLGMQKQFKMHTATN